MTRATIETRLARAEARLFPHTRGLHRYSDTELDELIAWLKNPTPADEERMVALLRRERMLP